MGEPSRAEEWQTVRKSRDLTIYVRHRSGSAVEELRAVGELEAPVSEVQSILTDVSKYSEFMPYLYTEGGGIPPFVANIANKQGVWQLFEALRERVTDPNKKL
ncbi:MAG: hypothetical protein C5B58_15100 [Acidobacteria bacterium]|nr:MAG: hypothetical protein C5B58_15100 [Acidobacteriota bacterium]